MGWHQDAAEVGDDPLGLPRDLLPGVAQDHEPGRPQRQVPVVIPFDGGSRVMCGVPVEFDDHSRLAPQRVDDQTVDDGD